MLGGKSELEDPAWECFLVCKVGDNDHKFLLPPVMSQLGDSVLVRII